MRAITLIAAVAAAVAGTPAPPPGIYCSVSGERAPIYVERDGVSIDGLDCRDAVVSDGRLRAPRCFTNSRTDLGAPYEASLTLLPDGALVHEMEIYRRADGAACP